MDGCFVIFALMDERKKPSAARMAACDSRDQGRSYELICGPGRPLCDSRDHGRSQRKLAAMDGCFVIFAIKDERTQ
jgi:hypothetical protein